MNRLKLGWYWLPVNADSIPVKQSYWEGKFFLVFGFPVYLDEVREKRR